MTLYRQRSYIALPSSSLSSQLQLQLQLQHPLELPASFTLSFQDRELILTPSILFPWFPILIGPYKLQLDIQAAFIMTTG